MSADVAQVAVETTHWAWWGAGVLVGGFVVWFLAAVFPELIGKTQAWALSFDDGKRWRDGYDAGVRAVKRSRSEAAKRGHETRQQAKRDRAKDEAGSF